MAIIRLLRSGGGTSSPLPPPKGAEANVKSVKPLILPHEAKSRGIRALPLGDAHGGEKKGRRRFDLRVLIHLGDTHF